MWISEDESEVVASTLFPKMKKTKQEHEDLLYEAVTLEVGLTNVFGLQRQFRRILFPRIPS